MNTLFFENPQLFRAWLEEHHLSKTEIWVGYYKKATGKPSMEWAESVDEALCFGWIDGIRKSIDGESYKMRFTPRKPDSIWSAVNIEKVEMQKKLGRMMPAGLAAYAKRKEEKSKIYAFEQENVQFSTEQETEFRQQETAWTFFKKQAPSYQKQAIWWVISAKQEITRQKRLQELILDSQNGLYVKPFRRITKTKSDEQ